MSRKSKHQKSLSQELYLELCHKEKQKKHPNLTLQDTYSRRNHIQAYYTSHNGKPVVCVHKTVPSNTKIGHEAETQHLLTQKSNSFESGILKIVNGEYSNFRIRKKSAFLNHILTIKCDAVLSAVISKLTSTSRLPKSTDSYQQLQTFLPYFILTFLQSMRRALTTLRKHEVVHSDIKPCNIGLRIHPMHGLYFVLFDLGSAFYYKQLFEENFIQGGTLKYLAPENPDISQKSPDKLDIHALGVTLLDLCDIQNNNKPVKLTLFNYAAKNEPAKQPTDSLTLFNRIHKILNASSIMHEIRLMAEAMSTANPDDRLSSEDFFDILDHINCRLPELTNSQQQALTSWYTQLINDSLTHNAHEETDKMVAAFFADSDDDNTANSPPPQNRML